MYCASGLLYRTSTLAFAWFSRDTENAGRKMHEHGCYMLAKLRTVLRWTALFILPIFSTEFFIPGTRISGVNIKRNIA